MAEVWAEFSGASYSYQHGPAEVSKLTAEQLSLLEDD